MSTRIWQRADGDARRTPHLSASIAAIILIAAALAVPAIAAAQEAGALTTEQKNELAQYFGFGPMEIYRIKPAIGNLQIADLNNDGRKDILLWNAEQNRFELFLQPDPNAPEAGPQKLERNEVPDRGRLVRKNIPVNYKVASAEIGDLTGDGRLDIVFYGEPRELVIVPQKEGGEFGTPEGIRCPDGNPRRGCLALGDFNGDHRTDAAILGADVLLIFLQRESGGLAPPLRLVHGIKNPILMLRADVNGDGRDDLLIGADDDRYGMYVCLQESNGALAALRPVRVPRNRSITVAPPVAGQRGDDIFCVELATNRLMHYRWEMPKDAGVTGDWPQRLHSYPVKSASKQRPLALGDIDGDGRIDCVTADPDAAQMILFRGEESGLGAGQAYPGLMKASDICIADLDGDGRNEILIASGEEKLIAVSRYENGRLTFPSPLPTQGQPYAVAVGSLKAGGKPDRFAYATKRDGVLTLVLRAVAGGDETTLEVKNVDEDPAGLRFVDVDQDGLNDLIMLVRFSPPKVFLQKEDGSFALFEGGDTRSSMLKELTLAGFAVADVTGDGKPDLLVAQEGFVRALSVKDGHWTVVDQYNPESADAKITGVAVIPGTEGAAPTIVAYERKAGDLIVFKQREDKSYAVSQTMPVGTFDLTAMDFLSIGDRREPAVLMADVGKLAVLRPQEHAETLVAKHSYESEQKDAWLADAVVGDLNHDGVQDIVAVDMAKAALEILTTAPDGSMVFASRFPVFRGRRFTDVPDTRGEPREVLIGDVTGDGIDDIVLVVHDRVIVYPSQ